MRIFPGIDHPSGVDRLPATFADWAVRIDAIERQIDAENEAKRWGG